MKKLMLLAAGIVASIAFAGCASTSSQPQLTPAQIIAIACPPIEAAVTQFITLDATMPTVPAAIASEALLNEVKAPVAAACTAGATISTTNVQAFATTVLPVLGTVAGTLPLPPTTMAEVQAGLVAAEIAVGAAGVVEQQIAAAQAANAASAPAAQ